MNLFRYLWSSRWKKAGILGVFLHPAPCAEREVCQEDFSQCGKVRCREKTDQVDVFRNIPGSRNMKRTSSSEKMYRRSLSGCVNFTVLAPFTLMTRLRSEGKTPSFLIINFEKCM